MLMTFLLVGSIMANDEHGHGHHDDDEWTWSSVWCPGSSWTSTKIRKVCCKTTSSCPPTETSTQQVTETNSVLGPCQTITATLWDIVADTLIICNKYTTECPDRFSDRATITFSVKQQGGEAANAAADGGLGGMIMGAALAIAGLALMLF